MWSRRRDGNWRTIGGLPNRQKEFHDSRGANRVPSIRRHFVRFLRPRALPLPVVSGKDFRNFSKTRNAAASSENAASAEASEDAADSTESSEESTESDDDSESNVNDDPVL